MATCEALLRNWGNSAGVIIPKDVIEREKLKVGQKVRILVVPKGDAPGKTFGILKGKIKMSGQEAKDMLRKELYND